MQTPWRLLRHSYLSSISRTDIILNLDLTLDNSEYSTSRIQKNLTWDFRFLEPFSLIPSEQLLLKLLFDNSNSCYLEKFSFLFLIILLSPFTDRVSRVDCAFFRALFLYFLSLYSGTACKCQLFRNLHLLVFY